jgi:hypothetical protein
VPISAPITRCNTAGWPMLTAARSRSSPTSSDSDRRSRARRCGRGALNLVVRASPSRSAACNRRPGAGRDRGRSRQAPARRARGHVTGGRDPGAVERRFPDRAHGRRHGGAVHLISIPAASSIGAHRAASLPTMADMASRAFPVPPARGPLPTVMPSRSPS